MKAILEFDLSKVVERESFKKALNLIEDKEALLKGIISDMRAAVWAIDDEEATEEVSQTIERIITAFDKIFIAKGFEP